MRVDPSHRVQTFFILYIENFFLCQCLDRIAGPFLLWHDQSVDGEASIVWGEGARKDAARFYASVSILNGVSEKSVHESGRDVDIAHALAFFYLWDAAVWGGRRRHRDGW